MAGKQKSSHLTEYSVFFSFFISVTTRHTLRKQLACPHFGQQFPSCPAHWPAMNINAVTNRPTAAAAPALASEPPFIVSPPSLSLVRRESPSLEVHLRTGDVQVRVARPLRRVVQERMNPVELDLGVRVHHPSDAERRVGERTVAGMARARERVRRTVVIVPVE